MKLQLIRNATLKLEYAGRSVLIDPFFAPKQSRPSFTGRSLNPLVDLPVSIETILSDVEFVVVSHLHADHFDPVAQAAVPKHLPLLCQPVDEEAITAMSFENVIPLHDGFNWQGLDFVRHEASHGLGPVVKKMGSVMGFTLEAVGEPRIYWAGDTVFYPAIATTLQSTRPDIVVTHSCGARWDGELIVMDAEQTLCVLDHAPAATVVATHMEALDHATIDRRQLREAARLHGIADSALLIPDDGDTLTFSRL
jgi:L-ascorbate metabolism protein UlaG (beta-lactamase superfamily)